MRELARFTYGIAPYIGGFTLGWSVRAIIELRRRGTLLRMTRAEPVVPRINAANVQAPLYGHRRYWYDGELHNIPPRAD